MRSSVDEWLDRLNANAEVATVLGSIPASFDTVESEGRQMKQYWIKYWKNKTKQKTRTVSKNQFICRRSGSDVSEDAGTELKNLLQILHDSQSFWTGVYIQRLS